MRAHRKQSAQLFPEMLIFNVEDFSHHQRLLYHVTQTSLHIRVVQYYPGTLLSSELFQQHLTRCIRHTGFLF